MSFFQDVDLVASHALDATAMSTPGVALLRFSSGGGGVDGVDERACGSSSIKVLVDTRFTDDKEHRDGHVAVISGGGAGHEPAHGGFVGAGMLAAAISGQVFASPGVEAILGALRAVTGAAGAILVVKNYTGDRLNFGLAAERARAEFHLRVAVITVADDIALQGAPQPRGLAGTLLVHKVAGYHAERGAPLEHVLAAGTAVARGARSLGVSLSTCTLPGQKAPEPFGENQMEVGLGIHGEPGAQRRHSIPRVNELVEEMLGKLMDESSKEEDTSSSSSSSSSSFAVLVNNLGGVSITEMGVITRSVIRTMSSCFDGGARCALISSGHMMTSLDMKGFSISTLRIRDPDEFHVAEALSSDVSPRAWVPFARPAVDPPVRLVAPPRDGAFRMDRPCAKEHRDAVLESKLAAVCAALAHADTVELLNRLDAHAGDGDCGNTFKGLATNIQSALRHGSIPTAKPSATLSALSSMCAGAGGSSGVILSIGLSAAAAVADPDPSQLVRAFVQSISEHGGARKGDRTLLDVMYPVLDALVDDGDVVLAAQRGVEATAHMARAHAGRSAYVTSKELSEPDPGAMAMLKIVEAWMGR